MTNSKNILVAPLNWGLGHATRCIPIIKALIEHDFTPLIASDGEALALLQKEFPNLKSIELPSYNIRYTKHGAFLKWKFILNSPKLLYAVYQERQLIAALIKQHNISGIISDNRFGVRHHSITSVYITHQVNVLSGYSTKLNSWLHQCIIAKFDECWIPDTPNNSALSGKLGQPNNKTLNLKHIGILSRFKKTEAAICYDYLILLSGPEPQRTILERKLLKEFQNTSKTTLLIQGKISSEQTIRTLKNITVYNFMTSNQLEESITKSEVIISRSGYTTLMDLAVLEKKAFFIPTPGQNEQEYLAEHMQHWQFAPYSTQQEFKLDDLKQLNDYKGLSKSQESIDFGAIFAVFN